ncbi:MAG: hypothetical protein Ct9H90mP27_4000 [Gammaproteobacteria bacterium]|nr:MAG: hypothetical protein Ct9H90mP27_4000 [Gammaproteobacteria bacterium]
MRRTRCHAWVCRWSYSYGCQIFWDPIGSCSCYHGVTSVVMGNCGFTLAPCRKTEADMVFRSLERAEDLSRDAMLAG